MSKKRHPELPLAPLPDLLAWLKAHRVRAVFIGGVAVALLARPRSTADLGLIVDYPAGQLERLIAAAPDYHISPRLPDVLEFARLQRVILVCCAVIPAWIWHACADG